MKKTTLRLVAGAAIAAAAGAGALSGCTAGDDLLPPGGQVSVSYLSLGTALEQASAYAYFLSDFVANDPADDPSVNPYADLSIGDCVAPIQGGAGNSQYTYADPGGVVLTGADTVTLTIYTNGELSYYTDMNPATFPFGEFFNVELSGAAEIESTSFSNAIATGDELAFTAPPNMNGSNVSIPDATDLTFTYNTTLSEVMVISVVDSNGTNGLMCRADPGTGGATNFVIAAADVSSLPASGVIVAFTYNYREDTLNIAGTDRTVTFVGQTVRAVPYTKN